MPERKRSTPRRKRVMRITVSLPGTDYDEVVRRAAEMRVSAAWIIRDAVEKYIKSKRT